MPHLSILDRALAYWEDHTFSRAIRRNTPMFQGALPVQDLEPIEANASRIRQTILSAHQHEADRSLFFGELSWGDLFDPKTTSHGRLTQWILPLGLWHWVRHSRRVFDVSEDLAALFLGTKFNENLGITHEHFPFESFVVRLEKPILDPTDSEAFSTILVYVLPKKISGAAEPVILCEILGDKLSDYRPSTAEERSEVVKYAKRENYHQCRKRLVRITDRLDQHNHFNHLYIKPGTLQAGEDWHEEHLRQFELSVLRIVMGVTLYLQTLPPDRSSKQPDRPAPPQKSTATLSGDADIFELSAEQTLSAEERSAFRDDPASSTGGGGKKRAHFRRGHWRTNIHTGPDKPLFIWVRPTIVHRSQVKKQGFPEGAVHKLEK